MVLEAALEAVMSYVSLRRLLLSLRSFCGMILTVGLEACFFALGSSSSVHFFSTYNQPRLVSFVNN